MKSVEEARALMIAGVRAVDGPERVPLEAAQGRVLDAPIKARRDQPPFAASSMDGYALRADDAPGRLRVIGEVSAGGALGRVLAPGEAARIFTGAPLPEGADAVLIQEAAKRDGDWLEAPGVAAWDNVRPRGLDFRAGDVLLPAATPLDAIALSLAAAAGEAQLAVRRRPRIALIGNGDEIVPPGAEPGPHQIFDSVSYGLAALVRQWGGAASRLPAVGDDKTKLTAAFEAGLGESDLLVTIGGASVGDRDLVKPALEALGLDLAVNTVAVRPGKPVFFGRTRRGPVLGLPGNPASALVCAYLFLRPILETMLGLAPSWTVLGARLAAPLPANGPREHYLRARVFADSAGGLLAQPAESQDSSLLSVFAGADALLRLPPRVGALAAGDPAEILLLDRGLYFANRN